MNGNTIITIGRQFGSGGHEIAFKLAEKLGIKCYDKELLQLAAKESGICTEIFNTHDEKPSNSLIYSIVMDAYSFGYSDAYNEMPINQKVFLAQFEAIKKLAATESCVIVGRCADYALNDDEDLVSVFITAPIEKRIERIMRVKNLDAKKAESLINKTDKKRSSYYDYYSDQKWGAAKTYDLCINSDALGIDKSVDLILEYIKLKTGK